ncbi:hypothetical protein H5410_041257 [Solanum commersonii]|uniref:Uncharacterized protein n=1 Tax=Solanum commersonii TaxID=4109 RepID=A0A9J5XT49_SOLCO|nr:hypothetical protein H5410_041257 [Solanum commersonii]
MYSNFYNKCTTNQIAAVIEEARSSRFQIAVVPYYRLQTARSFEFQIADYNSSLQIADLLSSRLQITV